MAISDTVSEIVLGEILLKILLSGEVPSITLITQRYDEYIAAHDLSLPRFSSIDWHVASKDPSSALFYNDTRIAIQKDLIAVFQYLFKTSDKALVNFEKWRGEVQLLDTKIDSLTSRITNLLLLATDTEGYFNYMQDNFVDTSKVDLVNSTAFVNIAKNLVYIGTSNSGATRIDLSSVKKEDVNFSVLTRNNLVSIISAEGSKPLNAISDATNYWQERVYTNKTGALSSEMKIKLPAAVTLSRIDLSLHMANQNGPTQITPMLSTDNYNWSSLPIDSSTRSVTTSTSFQFAPVSASWIKLILTKNGPDQTNNGLYDYEFGIDSFALFNEGFPTSSTTGSNLISLPLSITDNTGAVVPFSRLALDVCETVPAGTGIDYSIAVMEDPTTAIGSLTFVPIDPAGRTTLTNPSVLNLGDLEEVAIPGITLSYEPAGGPGYVSPSATYSVLTSIAGGVPVVTVGLAKPYRYDFLKSTEFILSLSMDPSLQIAQGSQELWRNVLARGSLSTVRNVPTGWKLDNSYYKTTVLVSAAGGLSLNWGSSPIIIDGQPTTGTVTLTQGNHSIWAHKNNWKYVDFSSITDLASIRAADSLYPFNHRYLVEGINYPSTWPTGVEKVYGGFDIVAESLAQQVSIFDLANNVSDTDYTKYAVDYDTSVSPLNCFVVKADSGIPDFPNETFLLRMRGSNLTFNYLRFKAVLSTTDATLTPSLGSYRVKVSS